MLGPTDPKESQTTSFKEALKPLSLEISRISQPSRPPVARARQNLLQALNYLQAPLSKGEVTNPPHPVQALLVGEGDKTTHYLEEPQERNPLSSQDPRGPGCAS